MMSNTHSQSLASQNDEKAEGQPEITPGEGSNTQNSSGMKKERAPSKREIMEQLSRERFPWDE